MAWLQITFEAGPDDAERIGMMLELCGALSVSTQGPDDEHRLQVASEQQPLWRHNRVTGLFPEYSDTAAIVRQITQALNERTPHFEVDVLAEQDWACAWKAHYRPIAITDRLWICPSWSTPPKPEAVNVILDPGMAFGTGEHPTTALCLAWLAEHELTDKEIIDFGSGSGVLSIAALKLGACNATAIEIDEQARSISLDNAQRNSVADRFEVYAPEALPAGTRADIVVANILAGPLVTLAPEITDRVRPGGQLAQSGLLAEQEREIWHRYREAFQLDRRERRGEWILLAATRMVDDAGEKT